MTQRDKNDLRPYGLYHVNRETQEVVPFSGPQAHGLRREEAEQRAKDCRAGEALGTGLHDDWNTEARLDSPETEPPI